MASDAHSQEDAFGTPPAWPKQRFYFDVQEGGRFIPDDEGLEFPDLDAAEREAAQAAADIGRDRLPKGDARRVTIEVRNEHGERVLTVTVPLEVDCVAPSPELPDRAVPWSRVNDLRWPQERREGVTIHMPDRHVPWARINDLYEVLYNPGLTRQKLDGIATG